MKRKTLSAIFGILIVSAAVIIPQWYLALHPEHNLDFIDFVTAIVIPSAFALVFFGVGRQRILLFAFFAYIWSMSDDAPVYLDSVFTWPEVTSGLQHTFLEILLHILTLVFIFMAVRESLKGKTNSLPKRVLVYALASAAFVTGYAQNIPIGSISDFAASSWYILDITEHVISFGLFAMALVIAKRMPEVKILPERRAGADREFKGPLD